MKRKGKGTPEERAARDAELEARVQQLRELGRRAEAGLPPPGHERRESS